MYYLHNKVVHEIIYEVKRRYNFLNLQAILTSDPIFSIYYYIYFFQSKRITKKIVKVIES